MHEARAARMRLEIPRHRRAAFCLPVGVRRGTATAAARARRVQRVGEAGDVEVAPAGGLAVLVEDTFLRFLVASNSRFSSGQGKFLRAKSTAICQSGRASPGRTHARPARARCAARSWSSVPSFSPQPAAGRKTSAYAVVSVLRYASCTITSSARSSASCTSVLVRQRLRRVGAGDPDDLDLAGAHGLEHLHRGLARLRRNAPPRPRARRLRARCFGCRDRGGRDSRLAMPPTSRPPIALGWPVRLKGPAPGLPICPVGEVQVDEGGVLRRAARGLVEALAVQREGRLRARDRSSPLRTMCVSGTPQIGRGPLQRGFTRDLRRRFEILGVPADVACRRTSLPAA